MRLAVCMPSQYREGQNLRREITVSVIFLPPGWVRLRWKQEQTFLSTYCVLRAFSAPLYRGPGRQLLGSRDQLHYCPGDSERGLAWPRSRSWWMQSWHRDSDLGPSSKNQRLPTQCSLPSPAKVPL